MLVVTSTLAWAGNAAVAEMADAAMMEKRLKFMALTLGVFYSSLDRLGRDSNLPPRGVQPKCFVALAHII